MALLVPCKIHGFAASGIPGKFSAMEKKRQKQPVVEPSDGQLLILL
jgi:hypothetical protein